GWRPWSLACWWWGAYSAQVQGIPQLTRKQVTQGEFSSPPMWLWILWPFWHDLGAVLGQFSYPNPSRWADEELGIPPDDED
ncbi:NADH dehydrogenase [ubiquinone] 1 beta subcomplex subunit 2, mitochondrial, partial [Lemmus lemmus]